MKAVEIVKPGGPEVLVLTERPKPSAAAAQSAGFSQARKPCSMSAAISLSFGSVAVFAA